MSYNGWTNRETWLVNVWFNPESKEDVQYARSVLEEQYDQIPDGPLKDMITLSEVNWEELESHFEEPEEFDDSMDGDAISALASAGWGTDEDYGSYGEE